MVFPADMFGHARATIRGVRCLNHRSDRTKDSKTNSLILCHRALDALVCEANHSFVCSVLINQIEQTFASISRNGLMYSGLPNQLPMSDQGKNLIRKRRRVFGADNNVLLIENECGDHSYAHKADTALFFSHNVAEVI